MQTDTDQKRSMDRRGCNNPAGDMVGAHAIVGAASVVTKDVPDYAVVVGNPARVVKMLDAEKFQ